MRIESPAVLVALVLAAAPALADAAEPPAEPAEQASEPPPAPTTEATDTSAATSSTAADASAGPTTAAAPTSLPNTTDAPPAGPATPKRRVRWYDIPPGDPRRVSIAAQLQVDLLGLAIGIRPEVLYRPFRATRGANLRFGFGLLPGPEYFFLPIDLGWRQHFVPHHRVTIELGAGYEQQFFFVRDAPTVTRGYFYAELGLAVRVASRGWLGVQFVPGWAPFGHPGPGIATRLGFRWDFGSPNARTRANRRPRGRERALVLVENDHEPTPAAGLLSRGACAAPSATTSPSTPRAGRRQAQSEASWRSSTCPQAASHASSVP